MSSDQVPWVIANDLPSEEKKSPIDGHVQSLGPFLALLQGRAQGGPVAIAGRATPRPTNRWGPRISLLFLRKVAAISPAAALAAAATGQ